MFDRILKLAFAPLPTPRASAGLLILRIFLGVGIFLHGLGKVGHVEGFAGAIGVPVPLAFLAVLSETVGGIALALGALTPVWSAMLAGTMGFAILHHIRQGDGFLLGVARVEDAAYYTMGWEFAALYFFGFVAILLTGPGRYALDTLLFRRYHLDVAKE